MAFTGESIETNGPKPKRRRIEEKEEEHFEDSHSKRRKKRINEEPLNFREEVKHFAKSSCQIIFFAVLEYLHICLDIQMTMREIFCHSKDLLHPFTNCITHTSFMYNILRQHCLNLNEQYLLLREFAPRVPASKFEVEFVAFLEHKHGAENIESKYSGSTQSFKWDKNYAIPDAIVNNKLAYFINGCVVHAHVSKGCHLVTEKIKSNLLYGQTFIERHVSSNNKIKHFREKYPSFEIKEIFECSWQKMQNTRSVKLFLKETKYFRPVQRLNPRDIQRGGIMEVYAHKNSGLPNETLYYQDVVSLYGYVSMMNTFPIGKFINLLGNDIKKEFISYENETFYYRQRKMIGFAHVRVLPPSNLQYPFLCHKINGKNILFNCYSCAVSNALKCTHECVSQRSFCDSYTLPEIAYAKKLKYEILEWHEIYLYPQEATILKDFVRILGSSKLKASGFPKTCNSMASKEKFCKVINEEMMFKGPPLALKVGNVCHSPSRRKFFKDAMNNVFGKFSSNQSSLLKCVESQADLERAFVSYDITDLNVVKNKCFIQYSPCNVQDTFASLQTNMPIGAHVSAFGRIEMHKNLAILEKHKCQIYLCNTDSILYGVKTGNQTPLKEGFSFGNFTNVYPGCHLENAALMTARNFTLIMRDEHGKLRQETKLSGFSQTKDVRHLLTPEMYFEFVKGFSLDQKRHIKLTQERCFRGKNEKKKVLFTLSNQLSANRCIDKNDPILKSYPFGFIEDV